MWASYFKELFGRDTIETESGFICYQIIGEECFICDFYVMPEKRKSIEGFKLIDSIADLAKNIYKCKRLSSSIHIGANGSETALLANLRYGFEPFKADQDRIYLKKELI